MIYNGIHRSTEPGMMSFTIGRFWDVSSLFCSHVKVIFPEGIIHPHIERNTSKPEGSSHRWFYFPSLRNDEVLIFKCFLASKWVKKGSAISYDFHREMIVTRNPHILKTIGIQFGVAVESCVQGWRLGLKIVET